MRPWLHSQAIQQDAHFLSDPFFRLIGLEEFLIECGSKINSLEIGSCDEDNLTEVTLEDLRVISSRCHLLDSLVFTHFNLVNQIQDIPNNCLDFKFLTTLKLINTEISSWPKEVIYYYMILQSSFYNLLSHGILTMSTLVIGTLVNSRSAKFSSWARHLF